MIPFHPLADIFPLVEGPDFDAMVEDIRTHKLKDPIDLLDGAILDGRNRYRACLAIDAAFSPQTEPSCFIEFRAGDPLAYVISRNLKRRHLNDTQRADIAAKIADLVPGRPAENPANLPHNRIPQASAAKMLSISERALRSAKVVHRQGCDGLRREFERGTLAISVAEQVALLPAAEQRRVVAAAAGDKFGKRVVVELKKSYRATREATLGARQCALPDIRAGVVLEDFEWHHTVWGDGGSLRSPDNHYPTARDATSPQDIVARTAERFTVAAPDCILFMWTTVPHLWIALQVMALRGFTYKSHVIWDKVDIATGYWSRGRHELLLIGTRGKVPAPAQGTQLDSIIVEKSREHSRKPQWQYELIERHFPTLPKIELNARHTRPGWLAWGNEAPANEDAKSVVPAHDPQTGEIVDVATSVDLIRDEMHKLLNAEAAE